MEHYYLGDIFTSNFLFHTANFEIYKTKILKQIYYALKQRHCERTAALYVLEIRILFHSVWSNSKWNLLQVVGLKNTDKNRVLL